MPEFQGEVEVTTAFEPDLFDIGAGGPGIKREWEWGCISVTLYQEIICLFCFFVKLKLITLLR